MLYETLRAGARVALRWYYRDLIVQGRERFPQRGPVLVVANHPNALVDALVVGTMTDRRVLLTAKATLFGYGPLALLLTAVGVVPLRRAKDEAPATAAGPDASRNAQAFELVTAALQRDGVVLVFPEGISHDQPALSPLKSGAARMALAALEAGTQGLKILPVGLVFEEKERPRSRVLVRVGEPLDITGWQLANPLANASSLTHEIEARLRRVTLNFATEDRARRAVRVAGALAAIAGEPSDLGTTRFAEEADIAARVESTIAALELSPPVHSQAADDLAMRLEMLEARLAARGVTLLDARISVRTHQGALFALREGAIMLFVLPVALFGRAAHWLPIRLARLLALRSLRGDSSRDQPAMRTIVLGMIVLVVWYGFQALVVARYLGIVWSAIWIASIFAAAQIDLRFDDRLARARSRARTFFVLRSDLPYRRAILAEMDALVAEAAALEQSLRGATASAEWR